MGFAKLTFKRNNKMLPDFFNNYFAKLGDV